MKWAQRLKVGATSVVAAGLVACDSAADKYAESQFTKMTTVNVEGKNNTEAFDFDTRTFSAYLLNPDMTVADLAKVHNKVDVGDNDAIITYYKHGGSIRLVTFGTAKEFLDDVLRKNFPIVPAKVVEAEKSR
jgi:hypothetical protein